MEQKEYIETCIIEALTGAKLGEVLSCVWQNMFRNGLISLENFTDEEIEKLIGYL